MRKEVVAQRWWWLVGSLDIAVTVIKQQSNQEQALY